MNSTIEVIMLGVFHIDIRINSGGRRTTIYFSIMYLAETTLFNLKKNTKKWKLTRNIFNSMYCIAFRATIPEYTSISYKKSFELHRHCPT